MSFGKPYKYEKIEIIIARILSLNKWILRFGILSITIILSIEFWLNTIPAYSKFNYQFGVIILKLSYSFFSAFIFYLLVVHLPKEKRKAKSYRILHNAFSSIHNNLYLLVSSVLRKIPVENIDEIGLMQFIDYCKLIKQNDMILVQNINIGIHGKTIPIIEYIYFVMEKTRIAIQQILVLNETMDSITLESSTQILDLMNIHFDSDNKNLNQLSYGIFEIYSESKELTKEFDKNHKSYAREYHHFARKKNLSKMGNEKS